VGHAALIPLRIDESSDPSAEFGSYSTELLLFRSAVDCAENGVVITAQTSGAGLPIVAYANPSFLAFADISADGWDEHLAREAQDWLTSPPNGNPLWQSLLESHGDGGVYTTDVETVSEDGSRKTLRLRSAPVCVGSAETTHRVGVVSDVTLQSDLADVAARNERLASIGLLAAGIAHEINNPIGSALLAAETVLTMLDSPESGPDVAACLRNIVTSMDRCGRIVRTLLRYSHEEPTERQACSISDVAKQSMELARPYAERYGATLQLEVDPDVPLVPMNPLEIELVLVNLVRNAVEAGKGSVVISIRTETTETGVRATVADNGCGMNREQLAHAFDPLYTTRRELGGSGLGMSIAQGIVQGHQGRMEVHSQVGQGTTVAIDLPRGGDPSLNESS